MEIEATYVGRRLTSKNKLGHFWLFDDGKEKGYVKQIAPAVIGERFKLTLEGDSVFIRGDKRPKSISETLDERHIKWSALDIAAKSEYDNEKALASLGKNNKEFDRRMQPLLIMFDSLRTNAERAAFVTKVTSELWRR